MNDDQPPPTPLPPAAQSPYPAHPAPHPPSAEPAPAKAEPAPAAIGPLGLTLIGGAVAAAVGLLVMPMFRRAPKKPVRKSPAKRTGTPRRKATTSRRTRSDD